MGSTIAFLGFLVAGAIFFCIAGIDQPTWPATGIGLALLAVAAVIWIVARGRHNKDHPNLFDPAYIDRKVERYGDGNIVG